MSLRRLSQSTVTLMLAQQTLPSLWSIIKELVENALDAHSPIVRVALAEYGTEWVEVRDEGTGITRDSLLIMCRFGGTSKIGEYEDLQQGIKGFGFRGEGLAAIRIISDMEVTTKVRGENKGNRAIYKADEDEPLINEIDCNEGTTIRVNKPFLRDKIRRDELAKNSKLLFKQIVDNLQTYAIIFPHVKFELHHSLGGHYHTILNYFKPDSTMARITNVFGHEIARLLGETSYSDGDIKLTAYLSNNIQSGSLKSNFGLKRTDMRLVVNSKPADFPKFLKVIVERAYTEHNPQAKYFILVFLEVPPVWVDNNLAKDKREILIKEKDRVGKVLHEALVGFLEGERKVKALVEGDGVRVNFERVIGRVSETVRDVTQDGLDQVEVAQEKGDVGISGSGVENERPVIVLGSNLPSAIGSRGLHQFGFTRPDRPKSGNIFRSSFTPRYKEPSPVLITTKMDEESSSKNPDTSLRCTDSSCSGIDLKRTIQYDSNIDLLVKPTKKLNQDPSIQTEQSQLELIQELSVGPVSFRESMLNRIKASDVQGDQTKFHQNHFKELQVIGQFNKGFIICKWRESDGRYYVVDQHAADEKFMYEKLKNDLKVCTQTLISPMVIDLSLVDMMTVEQNLSIFEDSGFKLKLFSQPEKNLSQVHIIGVPNVFYWSYDKQDFMDLLYLVTHHAKYLDDTTVPKAKREIATKACRSSTKIGDPLERTAMRDIVSNLSKLRHPWNCPHGRPTTIVADRVREPKLDRRALMEKLKITF